MAKVKFINGPYDGQELAIPEDGITIGRGKSCSVVIDDNKVSREHAAVRIENGNWWVYDLQSSNGTRVNDSDISAYELSDGDVIEVGGLKFVFETEGEEIEKKTVTDPKKVVGLDMKSRYRDFISNPDHHQNIKLKQVSRKLLVPSMAKQKPVLVMKKMQKYVLLHHQVLMHLTSRTMM
jgi:pSer/pThr/pTyr-binding forkhead associated (FHA) protein